MESIARNLNCKNLAILGTLTTISACSYVSYNLYKNYKYLKNVGIVEYQYFEPQFDNKNSINEGTRTAHYKKVNGFFRVPQDTHEHLHYLKNDGNTYLNDYFVCSYSQNDSFVEKYDSVKECFVRVPEPSRE